MNLMYHFNDRGELTVADLDSPNSDSTRKLLLEAIGYRETLKEAYDLFHDTSQAKLNYYYKEKTRINNDISFIRESVVKAWTNLNNELEKKYR